jgi:hypothetical protein
MVSVCVMETLDSLLNPYLHSIDATTNRNVDEVVWLWIAFQETPKNSRFMWRHDGEHRRKAVSNKGLQFEVGKGLFDWNSLIAIGGCQRRTS